MELSALTAQLRSKGVNISLKSNYKTYYKQYRHVIRFNYKAGKDEWLKVRTLYSQTIAKLISNLDTDAFRIRREYYSLNIYCLDLKEILNEISIADLKRWGSIEVGHMAEEVLEESKIKPELPRAQTTVVKRLPHNIWRYRVHWQPGYRILAKIGNDALSAIVDQINNDPNTKSFDERTSERIKRGNYWGTSYFYTNSEDVLCLITLITPLFIKKIEKFTTLEELNAKRTG